MSTPDPRPPRRPRLRAVTPTTVTDETPAQPRHERTTDHDTDRAHEDGPDAVHDRGRVELDATAHEPAPALTAPVEPPAPGVRRLTLVPATSIVLRPTRWLWTDRIPAGAIVLGPGREGIGKSLFCAWLTARVTTGTLTGLHHGTPRGVVYAATEDSWERTIAGRLVAAGADMARVFRVDVHHLAADGVVTLPLSLPRDCDDLADAMADADVALLVLDPLISAVDSRINVNQEELRGALEPLAALADRTGAAVFGLAHFNKAGGTDVLSRITGSRAFAAVARAAIAFARDPDAEDGSCVISQAKNNLGPLDLPSLRYRVEPVELDTPEGPAVWGRLVMLGETDRHVDDILREADSGADSAETAVGGLTARGEAAGWLADYLTAADGPIPSAHVKKAGRTAGFSERTIERAARSLHVTARSEGFPRITVWTLPTPHDDPADSPSGASGASGASPARHRDPVAPLAPPADPATDPAPSVAPVAPPTPQPGAAGATGATGAIAPRRRTTRPARRTAPEDTR